jgi:phenylpyruvate tautomerase PptA (4-oxalocrotonate tautomerase family)
MLPKLSALVAEQLGKPERYVMVAFAPQRPMLFANVGNPCAYLALKSIGLPAAKTPALSATLCQLIEDELGIPKARIYIEFTDSERAMWGWDGKTF